ncbi:MAG: ZIP family metal transporter [Planctomycetota bacterium]
MSAPEAAAADPLVQGAVILGVGLAGGFLPMLTTWTDRRLHAALALSTGIFLGAVFLHMLPALPQAHVGDHEGHGHGVSLLWSCVLVGVLAVYLLESLVFRTHDHDDLHRHRAVGWASFVGLSLHAFTTGLGLSAAGTAGASLALPVFVAIVAHKAFEGFSLMSVFGLAHFPKRRMATLLAVFALLTPLGVWGGSFLFPSIGEDGIAVAVALAAGTFLYVCLTELLPEVFHHREDILAKIVLLAVGIAAMGVIAAMEH